MFIPSLDTLFSLPFLSLFLLPSATTSYTTSLNILFFYLAWSSIVLSHPPLAIEFFLSFAVSTIFYILPSLLFLAFDVAIPSLSENVKAHGTKALHNHRHVAPVIGVSLMNVILGVALQTGIDFLFTDVLHIRSALRITTSLPMPWALAKDLARGYLVRGFLQYYIHRHLLHDSTRSPTLTRWHCQWHHSMQTCVPFGPTYDHPAAYLLQRWIPAYLPALLFRMHLLTYGLWTALLSLEQALAWSGYSALPGTILLTGIARRQDAHMLSGGAGNFAPWGVLDWFHGTSLAGRDVVDDLRDEARRKDVKGRAHDIARRAESSLEDAAAGLHEKTSSDDINTKRRRVPGQGKQ